ncbi:16S rRNA (guanine(527)-N(7))-methyltransferase RsmG [Thauera mechernichensis]|uniref:Ribosomal RNA small subunit methyltransferase G n=1 Tax=Thauera mechernichensis TaxID=82788 RepID=A0ABW3W9F0_9RHOO|nr:MULTISPECIES: 16S rRNA (guanine(527)-N(7))-methyltransferase RsmG [Thauera]HNR61419.1 16S rRNA (guanine(527)-N(7))-methyltransferase RsmG [Thauera sp.]MDG3066750.1 16S rRNA (guanine(527)-N(7))-methyltransferase RsmG [Thauera mechernichensis]WBL64452.1 16S rRNA (guanine(527)-N(7))-methyltransferase RsmG [Thauera sp. WB-2]HRJ25332.1 16S rRNA (guanine(527)-N(7))-methyltransferase RsmG [Thauera sp.]HRK09946.1 16S rRNA (guanine(527)-N(7))-methyltransferase RsmG [Thauera sp.]
MSGRLQPWAAQLSDGVAALGLALPQETVDRLLAFGELLLKWNKVYNLTAIRSPQEVITHHLLDSLAVLPHLERVSRLADIGSGGGLPGVALAIVRPGLVVSSIETVGKKASFQQQAKIELGLGNFSVLNKRVEQVQAQGLPGGAAEGVISRAFSSLADFVNLSGHLLAEGGALYAMKGAHPADEIAALPAGWVVAETHALVVPGLDAERHLLVIRRA